MTIPTPQETPQSLVGFLTQTLRADRARRMQEEKDQLAMEGQRLANQRNQQLVDLYPFERVQAAHQAGRELLPATVTYETPPTPVEEMPRTLRSGYSTDSPAFRIRGMTPQTIKDLLPKGPHVIISPEKITHLDVPEEEEGYGVDAFLGLPPGASRRLGGRAVDLALGREGEPTGLRMDDVRQSLQARINERENLLLDMRSSDPRREAIQQEVDDLTMTLLGVVSPKLDFQNEAEIIDALLDEHPDWSDEKVAERAARIKARTANARAIRGNLRDLAPNPRRRAGRSSGSFFQLNVPDLGPLPKFGEHALQPHR